MSSTQAANTEVKNTTTTKNGGLTIEAAMTKVAEALPILNRWTGTYTHVFAKPFHWRGEDYERLTFDWESLTGKDCIQIDAETRKQRAAASLEANDYPIVYLEGMAVRACTERNENGKRVINADALEAMPAQDCLRICRQARVFLAVSAL